MIKVYLILFTFFPIERLSITCVEIWDYKRLKSWFIRTDLNASFSFRYFLLNIQFLLWWFESTSYWIKNSNQSIFLFDAAAKTNYLTTIELKMRFDLSPYSRKMVTLWWAIVLRIKLNVLNKRSDYVNSVSANWSEKETCKNNWNLLFTHNVNH